MNKQWECPKCKNNSCETDQVRTTGGALSKFLNIQNKKFTAVTCTRCAYTELYKTKSSALGNIIDLFGN